MPENCKEILPEELVQLFGRELKMNRGGGGGGGGESNLITILISVSKLVINTTAISFQLMVQQGQKSVLFENSLTKAISAK